MPPTKLTVQTRVLGDAMMDQLIGTITGLAALAITGMVWMVIKKLDVTKSGIFWAFFVAIAFVLALGIIILSVNNQP